MKENERRDIPSSGAARCDVTTHDMRARTTQQYTTVTHRQTDRHTDVLQHYVGLCVKSVSLESGTLRGLRAPDTQSEVPITVPLQLHQRKLYACDTTTLMSWLRLCRRKRLQNSILASTSNTEPRDGLGQFLGRRN